MIRISFSITLALCALGGGVAQAVASQPAQARRDFRHHPYINAMAALANYRTCGKPVRAATFADLNRRFHAAEAAALAKGFGPEFEAVRRDYEAFLAVADIMACAGGPAAALANARSAVHAFELWVAAQPPVARAGRRR